VLQPGSLLGDVIKVSIRGIHADLIISQGLSEGDAVVFCEDIDRVSVNLNSTLTEPDGLISEAAPSPQHQICSLKCLYL
jgi:hypothetical protein